MFLSILGKFAFIDPNIDYLESEKLNQFSILAAKMERELQTVTASQNLDSKTLRKVTLDNGVPMIVLDENNQVFYGTPRVNRPDPEYLSLLANYNAPIQAQGRMLNLYGTFDIELNGTAKKLFLAQPKPFAWLFSDLHIMPWFILSTVVFLSGTLCFLLAWTLTKPLKGLQQQAQHLKVSNLENEQDHYWNVPAYATDDVRLLAKRLNQYHQKATEFLKRNEQLLADISHELRTPMARQRLAIDVIEDIDCDRHQRDSIAQIKKENKRVNHMLSLLLSYSKMQVTQATQLKPHALHELLEPLLHDIEIDCKRVLKSFEAELRQDTTILCDEFMFISAFENIARNAVRYAKSKVAFTQTIEVLEDKKRVVITIEDDGPGIPHQELENIFLPFFRVDSARSRSHGGIGLGLSIAKRSIALHGGTVVAQNKKAKDGNLGGLRVKVCIDVAS